MNQKLLFTANGCPRSSLSALGFIGTSLLLTAAAQATQPPDNVKSDSGGDTAMGTSALLSLGSGYQNTAAGAYAMSFNTTGYKNTAAGYAALQHNTSGQNDVAFGSGALVTNQEGNDNAALGMDALYSNASGEDNSAVGSHALYSSTANANSAVGYYAMYSTTGGYENAALGAYALEYNVQGIQNTALGFDALNNSTGDENTGVGNGALENITGSSNIAIGNLAGSSLTSGSNNIDIGSEGAGNDSGIIRVGTAGTQKQTFVAGIESSKITGSAVYITSGGRLGVLASSQRYKTAITPMGAQTDRLRELRPVTFHLKSDPKGALQYGLIAEEVARVFPELVILGPNGRIEGVRYDELAPMLVNELQKQREDNAELKTQLHRQQQQLDNIQAVIMKWQEDGERLAAR